MSNRNETKKSVKAMALQGVKLKTAYRRIMKGALETEYEMIAESLVEAYGADSVVKMLAGTPYFGMLAKAIPALKKNGIKVDDIPGYIYKDLLIPDAVISVLLKEGATVSELIEKMDDLYIAKHFDELVEGGMEPNEILAYIKCLDYFKGGDFIVKISKNKKADINILARNVRLHEYLHWIDWFNKANVDKMILVDKIRAEDTLNGMYAPYCKAFHEDLMEAIGEVESQEEREALILKVESAKRYDFSDVGSVIEWESDQ